MGADRNSPLPRKLDEFETGLDDMVQHLLQKDSSDEVRKIRRAESGNRNHLNCTSNHLPFRNQ